MHAISLDGGGGRPSDEARGRLYDHDGELRLDADLGDNLDEDSYFERHIAAEHSPRGAADHADVAERSGPVYFAVHITHHTLQFRHVILHTLYLATPSTTLV